MSCEYRSKNAISLTVSVGSVLSECIVGAVGNSAGDVRVYERRLFDV